MPDNMSTWARAAQGARGALAAWQGYQQERDAARAAQAEAAERQQEQRVARAAGANGVVKGKLTHSRFDVRSRVLTVERGEVITGRRRKLVLVPVRVPVSTVTSVRAHAGRLHVTCTDGREYRFLAPAVMADAILGAM